MPLYGTALYEQAKEGGFLREGFCDYALAATEPLIETPEFSAEDLQRAMRKSKYGESNFYQKPKLEGQFGTRRKLPRYC